jgi:hypothetical protein
MYVRRLLLASFACCVIFVAAGWAILKVSPEVTLEFTQAQLQEQLSPRFPAQKCILTACIELNNPKISLKEGADLFGIETTFVATLGKRSMQGTAKLEGKPSYEQESGNFYLKDVKVTEFTMGGNAPDFDEVVKVRGPAVMAAIMNRIPLYSVSSHPKYGAIAKHALRSVQVVDSKLRVVFANPLLLFINEYAP